MMVGQDAKPTSKEGKLAVTGEWNENLIADAPCIHDDHRRQHFLQPSFYKSDHDSFSSKQAVRE